MKQRMLIVGGSYAAAEAASQARESGYSDDILIVSNEDELPYQRPPLSKTFMKSDTADVDPLKGAAFYTSRHIDVELGVSVVGIDPSGTAELSNGRAIKFDSLVLAVGAQARKLVCQGADFANLHYLKSAEDARSLKEAATQAEDIVIIGGGFIGLELASTFVQQQKNVTVVEASDRVLARAVSPDISAFIEMAHSQQGVTLLSSQTVERITGRSGKARKVWLTNGDALPADLIVVGIGSIPNLGLAQQIGLETQNGILVDGQSQTSVPGIFAAGDCAVHRSATNPSGVRLESVQNAIDQARVAGANVAGLRRTYDSLPWFWSDQYHCKIQMAGLPIGATERHTINGSDKMAVFHFRDDQCVCVETINRPRDHLAARRALPGGVTKRNLQDVEFDVAALLKRPA